MRSALGLAIFLPVAILLGCTKPTNGPRPTPPAPVIVVVAAEKTVPVRLRTIGAVKSLASVAIRPRVSGQLTGVFFKEGDYVKNGQKLFTIDPRPYDAAVKQAEANMAKNDALLKGAQLELKRAETAQASGVGAATEYDAALTAVASAKAAVEADRGGDQYREHPGRLHDDRLPPRRPGRRTPRRGGQPRRCQRHEPARRHQSDSARSRSPSRSPSSTCRLSSRPRRRGR